MIAFTNGCFDLFHEGHRRVLEFAAEQAPRLVVAINDDHWITSRKGPGRPIDRNATRIANVENFLAERKILGQVVVFESESQLSELIRVFARREGPLVLVKGEDYRDRQLTGEQFASRIAYAPLVPGVSTTLILEGRQGWIDTSNWAEI